MNTTYGLLDPESATTCFDCQHSRLDIGESSSARWLVCSKSGARIAHRCNHVDCDGYTSKFLSDHKMHKGDYKIIKEVKQLTLF